MNLVFENPGFEYSINSIMLFQNDEISDWWREALFDFYPQLNQEAFNMLETERRRDYLGDRLREIYVFEEELITDKVIKYNEYWKHHQREIEESLYEAFGINIHNSFNDIRGYITFNPICPRFLDTHTFDVFYKYSKKGAMGTAIHEVIHFVWFDVWHRHYNDDVTEYETPNLKWVFSEAAVDTITRNDKRLYEKYPHNMYAYEYFYDIKVNGITILETLNNIYQNTDIIGFMEKGYNLFKKYESEIRIHMK